MTESMTQWLCVAAKSSLAEVVSLRFFCQYLKTLYSEDLKAPGYLQGIVSNYTKNSSNDTLYTLFLCNGFLLYDWLYLMMTCSMIGCIWWWPVVWLVVSDDDQLYDWLYLMVTSFMIGCILCWPVLWLVVSDGDQFYDWLYQMTTSCMIGCIGWLPVLWLVVSCADLFYDWLYIILTSSVIGCI